MYRRTKGWKILKLTQEPALMQECDDPDGTGSAVRVVGVGFFQQRQQGFNGVVMQIGLTVQDGLKNMCDVKR